MPHARRLVLASHNLKKTGELRAILAPLGFELLSLADFPGAPVPEENGATFEENAVIKARSAVAHTGVAAIADDSGLAVAALGGEPGVWSARYAGEDADDDANNRLLLKRLADVPPERRNAAFVSVVAVALPDGTVRTYRGEAEGVILAAPRGNAGFGYDPLFLSNDLGVTFAEADADAKNRISHRGRALSLFIQNMDKLTLT